MFIDKILRPVTYSMTQTVGETFFGFMVCPEELMGEVLSHEGKHQIGSLRIWPKCPPLKETLC